MGLGRPAGWPLASGGQIGAPDLASKDGPLVAVVVVVGEWSWRRFYLPAAAGQSPFGGEILD